MLMWFFKLCLPGLKKKIYERLDQIPVEFIHAIKSKPSKQLWCNMKAVCFLDSSLVHTIE